MAGLLCRLQKMVSAGGKWMLFLATILLTVGVYLFFPERGMLGTFPLLFLFSAAAYCIYPKFWQCVSICALASFLYGGMGKTPQLALFVLCSSLQTVFAAAFIKLGKKWLCEKKVKQGICCGLFLFAAILLPLFHSGTPFAYQKAYSRAETYLKETYPRQEFKDLILFYDPVEKCYRADVSYQNGEGVLHSQLMFTSDQVQDGFRQDYAIWMMDMYKAELIAQINSQSPHPVVLDSLGFTEEGQKFSSYSGSFGSLSEEMIPFMHYSATFRKEHSTRKSFIEDVKEMLAFLKEKEVLFGEITFYGQVQDTKVYACRVTPTTDAEEILYLSEILNEACAS